MHGSLRGVEYGALRAAGPSRRTWRGFSPELADVLCVECTGEGLPMQAQDGHALVLPGGWLTDPQGRAWAVGPGEIGIARPGEMYRIDAPGDGGTLQVLLLGPEMLAAAPGAEPLRFRAPVARDAELSARLQALFAELRRGLTALDSLTRLRDALAALQARHLPRESAPEAARRVHPGAARAYAYLAARFAEPVSLDTLTAVSRLSRFYLLRVFRRDYGVTPHEYQRHLRVARACRLLAAGTPASHAAYEVGFADQSHLTRVLKALTGLTPGAFARQWTGARRHP